MAADSRTISEFTLDKREEDIRDWYSRIMKGEAVLADIGARAFRDVMETGIRSGLLDDPDPITSPREIIDVVLLFRRRLRQPSSDETIGFYQVGRGLGRRPDNLFCRRCVELPQYFEVLHLHRNKGAHRGAVVTEASLCAFAGAVLGVLELSSDEWVDVKRLNLLREEAKEALVWATNGTNDGREETSRLHRDLDQRDVHLRRLKTELQELRGLKAEGSQGSPLASNEAQELATKSALTSTKAHVTKKVNEAKDEMERHLEKIGSAIASLRSEVLDAQEHDQPLVDEEDTDGMAQVGHGPQLTRGQAWEMLQEAFRRMRDSRGVHISVNVFQRWIVEDALDAAAAGEMDQVDDWWKLTVVLRKTVEEREQMAQQLKIPKVEDWMMDIYRRVERRSDAEVSGPTQLPL